MNENREYAALDLTLLDLALRLTLRVFFIKIDFYRSITIVKKCLQMSHSEQPLHNVNFFKKLPTFLKLYI